MPSIGPDPNDLTTVANVEAYAGITQSTATDANIQLCLTSASKYFARRTGRTVRDDGNVFAKQLTFSEWYDGEGGQRQYVFNPPLVSVSSVIINGVTVPASDTNHIAPGWVIDQDHKSLAMIGGPISRWNAGRGTGPFRVPASGAWLFANGVQNVQIAYLAGYEAIPTEIVDKVTQLVAVNYKRQSWIDQASQTLNEAGTIAYRAWAIPPEVEQVIQMFKREAIV